MIHWLSTAFSTYALHPLHNNGYQWWSGAGSDLSEVTLLIAITALLRRHNCHQHGCWRLSWHAHPEHGHPVCRKHFPNEHIPGHPAGKD